MLKKLTVRNFKCLHHVSLSLSPFNVIIGRNDTGKTSFLDAIQLLARFAGPQHPELASAWAVKNLITHDATEAAISWEAQVDVPVLRGSPIGEIKYTLAIGGPQHGDAGYRIIREGLKSNAPDLSIAGHSDDLDEETIRVMVDGVHDARLGSSSQTALSYAQTQGQFPRIASIARSLSSTMLYRLDPDLLGSPAAFQVRDGRRSVEARLSHDGSGLALVLDEMLGSRRAAFAEVESELKRFAPYIKSISVRPHVLDQGVGKALYFELVDGAEAPAQLMSDGVLLFLTFLTLVHGASTPRMILIEEPENGVHPAALKRIATVLQRLVDPSRGSNAVQVVLTTHSPYLLDCVPRESVVVFGRDKSGGCVVRPLLESSVAQQHLSTGYTLGEMWYNLGEDVFLFPDAK